jgi:dihydrofolate reductase
MTINLMYAQSLDGFIGRDGKLPWHVPEDLGRFKWLTSGRPVIMGRATWDSLPEKFKPLPGRRNIIMTHQVEGSVRQQTMSGTPYWYARDVEDALDVAKDFLKHNSGDEIWVIGGSQIYNLFLPIADLVYMTLIHVYVPDGDARAPILPLGEWKATTSERLTSTTGIEYENVIFKREKC